MNKINRNVGCAALVALLAASAPAWAGDAPQEPGPRYGATGIMDEVTQALIHANYGATASSIEIVHEHLHHIINCLVGPKGQGFEAKWGNPCHGMGDGAIPDARDAAQKNLLEEVVKHADAGLQTDNLVLAKDAARVAVWSLMVAM
jgi:hypothetical protein